MVLGCVGVMGTNTAAFATSQVTFDRVHQTTHEKPLPTQQNKENNIRKSTIDRLQDLFDRNPQRGGSRGDFCAITPNPSNGNFRTSWSTRPLFAWEGDVTRMEIKQGSALGPSIWNHALTNQEKLQRYLVYSGNSELARNESYVLIIEYNDRGTPQAQNVRFEVLQNAPTIEARLAGIGDPNGATNTTEREERAVSRAEVFADADLWMDAMREILLVNGQGAWANIISSEIADMCE